jgi:pimeloyl-ACP methyl ester carboxylesterase
MKPHRPLTFTKITVFLATALALSLAVLAPTPAEAKADQHARPLDGVIAVDFGSYLSPQQAATNEANVNWNDSNLADDTICTASFAAVELQDYLRRLTGAPDGWAIVKPATLDASRATPAILISTFDELPSAYKKALALSPASAKDLGAEGFILKTVTISGRSILVIAAPARVGLLYGVYGLLDKLGVRWYAPGKLGEVLPASRPAALGSAPPSEPRASAPAAPLAALSTLDTAEKPAFLTRGFHAWENRADRDFLLWMARNRLNYWCVEQKDKPFLHKLGIMLVGGAHVLTSLYLGPNLEYPYNHPRFTGDENKPPDPYAVSPDYQGDADKNGKLTYFEAHPEWFGLIKGKRSPRVEGDFGDNFCTSNADAIAEFMKNAVRDLIDGRYKDANIINAWTLDVGNWCECDKCKALGPPTDRNILFVDAYARAIKKAQAEGRINRPIRLLFLAYADVIDPPTRPLPAGFDYDMCIATFFPIVRCYVHNFDDPNCSVNAKYLKSLDGWFVNPARFYKGQVCIGEYYNVSGYKCLPIVFMHTMAHDIPYYYGAGARHFHYMHVTTANWGPKALTNWQMARELWDPAADAEAFWTDYFVGRYGSAAPVMRRVYESLEKMLSNVTDLKYSLGRRLGRGEADLFPTQHLKYEKTAFATDDGPDLVEIVASAKDCRRLIDEAAKLNLPDAIARRIAEDERVFRYGERTVLFYDALCRTKFALDAGHESEALAAVKEARDLAALLKADTVSTKFSSAHANADDALEASYAAPALRRFEEKLGLVKPDEVAAAPVYADKFKLLDYVDDRGIDHPVTTPAEWQIRRRHILLDFQKVAGPLPDERRRVMPDMRVLGEEDLGDVVRKRITFYAEPGNLVQAYLLIPKKLSGRAPAALCPHQTTPRGKDEPAGLTADRNQACALELARRGYVTMAPDYPGYGDDKTDPYALGYESATMKGIWNHLRAVDVLAALPEVDPDRIAVIGHSLGGHNSMFVALFDPRIKAVVTSCGFTSFQKYYKGDLTGWSHKGYMPKIASVYEKNPDKMPFEFSEVLAALAPRPVFINAPLHDDNFDVSGVDDCVRAAEPVYALRGAKGAIVVVHPDAAHSFPPEIRQQAYRFLDKALGVK